MDKGKTLEKKFQIEMKNHGVYYKRFYDSRSFGRVGATAPSDFFIWTGQKFILVECKESKKPVLYFDKIRPSQYKGYKEIENIPNSDYLVLIEFNKQLYLWKMVEIYYRVENKLKLNNKGIRIQDKKPITWNEFIKYISCKI